jgi:RNase P subunit RPR2
MRSLAEHAAASKLKCQECGRFFENFSSSAGCPMGHGRLRPKLNYVELEEIETARQPKEQRKMDFLGDSYRRCAHCNRFLANGFDVRWKQGSGKNWRKFTLTLYCTQCGRGIGPVAKSNMPEDKSLIPPLPDVAGQKELFHDAGGQGSEKARYLSEDAPGSR